MTATVDSVRAPSALPRVLIVEDDGLVGAIHARLLRSVAGNVVVVPDAARALDLLGGAAFDVVISDILMPGMDGSELLRTIRKRDRDLPVIFLTGAPSLESAAAAVEQRAYRYLTKPVPLDVLRDAVVEAGRLRPRHPAS